LGLEKEIINFHSVLIHSQRVRVRNEQSGHSRAFSAHSSV